MLRRAEFQSQTSPLLPADLVQVYLFLLAAKAAGRRFFAFYNCESTALCSSDIHDLALQAVT